MVFTVTYRVHYIVRSGYVTSLDVTFGVNFSVSKKGTVTLCVVVLSVVCDKLSYIADVPKPSCIQAVMISCIIVTNLKIDEMELDSKPGKKVETVIKLYAINADAK